MEPQLMSSGNGSSTSPYLRSWLLSPLTDTI
ncbi:hypothetical protein CKAH01_02704 [Colletotrichum kahawae]|uniref:Uncharacterized protein n=1 Tax=Colletotrichum kahawae TaxID=34407 RepID=A0AAD9XYF9_COLKA|nr:hypothetical protein CKAH01_02704 [Colletotrichum kahawae]